MRRTEANPKEKPILKIYVKYAGRVALAPVGGWGMPAAEQRAKGKNKNTKIADNNLYFLAEFICFYYFKGIAKILPIVFFLPKNSVSFRTLMFDLNAWQTEIFVGFHPTP